MQKPVIQMQVLKKILLICIGSIVSAYGIDLAIHAGFSGATLAVLWEGIAKIFNISIGQASLAVAGIMILVCLFYDRKQINIGTLIYQILYGVFVDIFADCLFYSENVFINFVIMILGILIFAAGTALYSFADFGRGSYEALTFALVKKHGWNVKWVRTALDAGVVVIGALLGGKVGICTICTILLSGFCIQSMLQLLKKITQSE